MANLRKEARGRECQVRIYGVCNGNPETTVLAHYRMAGICGTGMKPDDLIGAWACISALVICIIVCLSWAVNHYRDNAITYKAQRDKNARELKLANAAITDMQMRQRDVAELDARYTKELADANATRELETKLHQKYYNYRSHGEWFSLNRCHLKELKEMPGNELK